MTAVVHMYNKVSKVNTTIAKLAPNNKGLSIHFFTV